MNQRIESELTELGADEETDSRLQEIRAAMKAERLRCMDRAANWLITLIVAVYVLVGVGVVARLVCRLVVFGWNCFGK